MKTFINILIIVLICGSIKAQSKPVVDSIWIYRIDTACNYVVRSPGHYFILPDNFDFNNNQRGFVLFEFTIESEKIKSWKIALFRILDNDSIIRNYSSYIDEKIPSDIDALIPSFENIIKKISLKPIDKEAVDSNCKIGFKFDFIKS